VFFAAKAFIAIATPYPTTPAFMPVCNVVAIAEALVAIFLVLSTTLVACPPKIGISKKPPPNKSKNIFCYFEFGWGGKKLQLTFQKYWNEILTIKKTCYARDISGKLY
jgi:hypothetical protein